MAALLSFLLGRRDDGGPAPSPLPAPPPRYHIRLLLCEQSDSRPHVLLYDSLAPLRHKSTMVPGRLLDYPTPIMLSEMMFGSMPIKSQADGLKVYCIPKEQACKAIFIKLFCVDADVNAGNGHVARIRCKTQFALAVVFSVVADGDGKGAGVEGAAGGRPGLEATEVGLLLAHFSFVEVQLAEALQVCSDAIRQAIAAQHGAEMEEVARARLPKGCLQDVPAIRAAAKTFMETLLLFLHPQPLAPPFFAAHGDGAMAVRSPLAKAGRFFAVLCDVLDALDTPQGGFLLSAAVTALLMHHLSWLSGIVEPPGGAAAVAADANAVCAAAIQHLYGMCNPGGKYCKVVIVGPDSPHADALVDLLTYFVRCGSVIQRVDTLEEPDFLSPSGGPSQPNGGPNGAPSKPPSEDSGAGPAAPAQEVPFPAFRTREFCETAGQHCFSAHTSCLSVPFVIMRPPLAFQAQRGPTADNAHRRSPSETVPSRGLAPPAGLELQDQDLLALCRDPVVCRLYDGAEEDTVVSTATRCQCVVVNLYSKLCYVAQPEHGAAGTDLRVSRRVIPPSDFIHRTLHLLRGWKKHLHMKDVDLFQYLDSQLYVIYQQSTVLQAIVDSGCPETLSCQLIGSILGVATSHVPLVLAVAACCNPAIKAKLPEPPLASFTPPSRLESLIDNLF